MPVALGLSWYQWAVLGGIVCGAFVIRAAVGFASNLIAVSVLSWWWPIHWVVPLVVFVDLLASLALGLHDRPHVQWRELTWLGFAILAGLGVGVWGLAQLHGRELIQGLGAFVVGYAAYGAYRIRFQARGRQRAPRWWGGFFGLLAGLLGGLYGTGGPPVVAYLQLRRLDKRAFRATFQGVGVLFSLEGTALYWRAKLLGGHTLMVGLSLLPVVLFGLFLGNSVYHRLDARRFQYGVCVVLASIGVKLLLGSGA